MTVDGGYTRVQAGAAGVLTSLTLNGSANFNMTGSGTGTLQIGLLNGTGVIFAAGGSKPNYIVELGVGTASTDSASYAGIIRGPSAGTLTLKKVGDGTQTLTRNGFLNAGYSNSIKAVSVEGGTLIVNSSYNFAANNNAHFFENAPITVSNGATLTFAGLYNATASASLTVNSANLSLQSDQYINNLTLNTANVSTTGTSFLRVGYFADATWNVTGGETTIRSKITTVKETATQFTINIAEDATLNITGSLGSLGGSFAGTNLLVQGIGDGAGTIKFNGANVVSELGTITFDGVAVNISAENTWRGSGYFSGSTVNLKNTALTSNARHFTNGTTFNLDHSTIVFAEEMTYVSNINLRNGSSLTNGASDGSFRVGYNWNSVIGTVFEEGDTANIMNYVVPDIQWNRSWATPQGSLTFNVAENAPLTVSGKINVDLDVTKTGNGVLILANTANSMTSFDIQNGTVRLNANGTQGGGSFSLAKDAVLEVGVTDTVDSVTTIDFSAQDVTLNGTVVLDFFSDENYDKMIFGDVTVGANGSIYVDLHDADTSNGQMFDVIDFDNLAGEFNVMFSKPGWSALVSNGQVLIFDNNSVPEPSTWALLLLGAVWLGRVGLGKRAAA